MKLLRLHGIASILNKCGVKRRINSESSSEVTSWTELEEILFVVQSVNTGRKVKLILVNVCNKTDFKFRGNYGKE